MGDLGVFQPLHPAQLEDLAAARRQQTHGSLQGGVDFTVEQGAVSPGRGGQFGRGKSGAAPDHLLMANEIEGPVAGRAEQIGLQRGFYGKRLPASPQLEHHILRQLLGGRTLSQHPLGEMDEACVVGAEDDVEGSFIAVPELGQQLALSARYGAPSEDRGIVRPECPTSMNMEPTEPLQPDTDTWDLLARYLAGESSAQEAERVRQWLGADPARAQLVQTLDRSMQRLPQAADVDVEAALQRVKARRLEVQQSSAWRRHLLQIAAAIIVVLGGSLLWRSATQRSAVPAVAVAHVYSTRPGATEQFRLADGTAILLGPGSRLQVPADYGTRTRTVTLNGAALFDVPHDASRPFNVRAGDAVIRDIGTRFAVRHDPGAAVHVVVTAGSVVLHAVGSQESQGVVLHAGDHGVLDRNGRALAQAGGVADDDLAWTQGRLVFDDASLDQVAAELRRWYGIELRIADSVLSKRHVTASFQDEPVAQVLKVIALTLGARIELNGNTAIVYAR